jgi:hypothetical protein
MTCDECDYCSPPALLVMAGRDARRLKATHDFVSLREKLTDLPVTGCSGLGRASLITIYPFFLTSFPHELVAQRTFRDSGDGLFIPNGSFGSPRFRIAGQPASDRTWPTRRNQDCYHFIALTSCPHELLTAMRSLRPPAADQ